MTIKSTTINRILISLCAILIIGVTGCGDDSDTDKPVKPTIPEPVVEVPTDLVGTWSLETIGGMPLAQAFLEEDFFKGDPKITVPTNMLTFNSDGTWAWDIEIVVENKPQKIRVTMVRKGSGTYTTSDFHLKMIGKGKVTWSRNGQKIEEEDIFATDSATWRRVGDRLTVRSRDENTVFVFKKR